MDAVDELVASLAVHDSDAGRDVLMWWLSGLDAVEPRRLVRSALAEYPPTIDGTLLTDSVVVLAVGKAASAMTWGADDALGDRISGGLVISDIQRSGPSWAATMVGDHPVPTARSATAAIAAIDLVDAVTADQTLLALISGGGSSLMEVPDKSLQLSDVQDVVDQLIRSGAPIETINGIRGRLSRVKAGQLATRCRGTTTSLVLSDVSGSDPSNVASGPTVASPGESAVIRSDFEKFGIAGAAATRVLASVEEIERDTAPTPRLPFEIVANGRTAGNAVMEAIYRTGTPATYVDDSLDGDACSAALEAVARTRNGEVGVFTGETTVVVSGDGRGGRNQHAALAAACELIDGPTRFLACGTDGIDGPTDAAGAFVDGWTVRDIDSARRHLERCDAYPFLNRARALIRTGSTGTNVGDLWIVDKRH